MSRVRDFLEDEPPPVERPAPAVEPPPLPAPAPMPVDPRAEMLRGLTVRELIGCLRGPDSDAAHDELIARMRAGELRLPEPRRHARGYGRPPRSP